MKLTWHIVWKDLTRLRLTLAVWAATFLWEYALGLRLLRGRAADFLAFERLRLNDGVAYDLQIVIGYLLVAALVHEDPLVGSTAFWPTRPISGLRLLGAKILDCLIIFVVIPTLLTLPWWLYCGYDVQQVFWAALDTFCQRLPLLLIGLSIASVTANVSRFLAGTLFAVAVVAIVFVTLEQPDLPTYLKLSARGGISVAPVWWWIGLTLACLSAIVAHQYFARRTVLSVVMLGCAAGIVLFEASRRPWELQFFVDQAKWPNPSLATSHEVAIGFQDAAHDNDRNGTDGAQDIPLIQQFALKSIPPGLGLVFKEVDCTWDWPNDPLLLRRKAQGWPIYSVEMPERLFPRPPPSREWWNWVRAHGWLNGERSAQTYEEFRDSYAPNNTHSWDVSFVIPRTMADRMRSDPPGCTVDFKGDLIRWDPRPEFAFAPGNGWDEGARGVQVGKMEWNPKTNSMDVTWIEHYPTIDRIFNPNLDPPLIWLDPMNRGRRESARSMSVASTSMRIATVEVTWRAESVAAPSHWRTDRWVNETSPDWFAGATVAGRTGTVVNRFETKARAGRFSLKPDAAHVPDSKEN